MRSPLGDSGGKSLPPSAPQRAGRTVAAAIAPGVTVDAIAAIAAVRLLAHQLDESAAAEPVGELPGRPLVAPHQRRVDDEAMIHAERQGRLQRLERVVAAIGIAGIV